METVKVDIQKLQLLNDRIAQTIEALNQVRMSVHGIQHTQQVPPWGYNPYATPSFGFTPGFSGAPQYASPYGMQFNPYSPFPGGVSHTPWTGTVPTTFQPGISHTPWDPTTTPWQATPWQTTPWQTTPWQTRMAQTVPFVQYLQPTTIS
jgi:hypothetical protein